MTSWFIWCPFNLWSLSLFISITCPQPVTRCIFSLTHKDLETTANCIQDRAQLSNIYDPKQSLMILEDYAVAQHLIMHVINLCTHTHAHRRLNNVHNYNLGLTLSIRKCRNLFLWLISADWLCLNLQRNFFSQYNDFADMGYLWCVDTPQSSFTRPKWLYTQMSPLLLRKDEHTELQDYLPVHAKFHFQEQPSAPEVIKVISLVHNTNCYLLVF